MTDFNKGTVRPMERGDGTVFQAYLPRAMSEPPRKCKDPKNYQEPVGPPQATELAARTLLNAIIAEQRDKTKLTHGIGFLFYIDKAIEEAEHQAIRKYGAGSRANTRTSTWRSIKKNWLESEDFVDWPPAQITVSRLKIWVQFLTGKARGQSGQPLSIHFVRNCMQLVNKAFALVPDLPNPMSALVPPERPAPDVIHLLFHEQRKLYVCDEISFRDRLMIGVGMGFGLRIGELLSLEAGNVIDLWGDDPELYVEYGGPDRSPTKGEQGRPVQAFEPGLGFLRLWFKHFGPGEKYVFEGPQGGYLKAWPEQFGSWSSKAGVRDMTSHIMRHSYAVSLLSGWWGYEPKKMEFVSQQLGHADIATTERYYARFDSDAWRKEARRMRGGARVEAPVVVTAASLLGSSVPSELRSA